MIVSAACGRNHTLALTGEEWLVSSASGQAATQSTLGTGVESPLAVGQDGNGAWRAPEGVSQSR